MRYSSFILIENYLITLMRELTSARFSHVLRASKNRVKLIPREVILMIVLTSWI